MNDHSKITEKLHSAIVVQWQEAINTDTSTEWNYTSGFLAGFIAHNPADNDLLHLHSIAAIRANMATTGNTSTYATLTPAQRLQELFNVTTRMKAHSVVIGQIFIRPATKQAAISGMNSEVENLTTLWAIVKADVEEMGGAA